MLSDSKEQGSGRQQLSVEYGISLNLDLAFILTTRTPQVP